MFIVGPDLQSTEETAVGVLAQDKAPRGKDVSSWGNFQAVCYAVEEAM